MTRQRNQAGGSPEPDDLFHSIKSRIAGRGQAARDEGITVDLSPSPDLTEPREEFAAEAAEESEPSLEAGQVLRDRYVIESRLGRGGMGTVYRALDQARNKYFDFDAQVAIKVLHQQTSGHPEVLAKLHREFFCAQALSHPSIIKVYSLDLEYELPFFTMELIDGESLPKVMQRFSPRPLPRSYVLGIIREVGAGLAHAHDRHVIHGDMKPQNIMVTNSGEVRILDFGTSGESATALTPAYASCELLEGLAPDPRDDIYALACLSYELLAGEHPFQRRRSTEARELKIMPARPSGLTPRQWRALKAGLSLNRETRPPSMRAWIADLDLGDAPLGPPPDPHVLPVAPVRRVKPSKIAAAVFAVSIVCATAWAILSRPSDQPANLGDSSSDTAASTAIEASALPDTPADTDPPVAVTPAPAAPVKRSAGLQAKVRVIDPTPKIDIGARAYAIRPDQKFAEIRIHRSSVSKGSTRFDWWTEPASALAGADFVAQAPATTVFPSGKSSVSVFIKLIPNASRKRKGVFYVAIGNPRDGALGAVAKAAVSLPPTT
jgi:eukaryotic-like serine/threonine-protein kinase